MTTRLFKGLAIAFAGAIVAFSSGARAEITVLMSGGFGLAYQEVLPEFERTTGIKIVTTTGASQGTGPSTIKAQLERGAHADLVILSKEGLDELSVTGRILRGTEVGLATTPLGAAVHAGSPKPDVTNEAALRKSLLEARLITMPGSTSGMYIKDTVLQKLGIADKVRVRVVARGVESTKMLAAGESDMALGPVSELVHLPGVDFVGALPNEFQLVQEFTAAIIKGSNQVDDAKRLIAFLSSGKASAAIRKAGMEPVGK
ncbi:extracellular solute-binding protein [Caballeronia calidae]|uniref:Extracellular solute-binding protein n=1 Tax=Caballeronia calidae TaxID=1777139 RepID=A0A158CJ09_9BURK|nr:substrate-binding domain-containing protein [Caballeronia calidae]SAK82319.1 extracellular solute-binding protein [Caballeronia calidae]